MNFENLNLSPDLVTVVRELGYEKATPIQEQAIPLLLAGRDIIGQSRTGSGKTAAFALPILQKIDLENRAVQALIICPTRELCTQVAREIRRLGRRLPALQVLIISGGQPMGPQIQALYRGTHIVVSTPGRLVDLMKKNHFDGGDIKTLVLDEADRMMDMGFEDDMRAIMSQMPEPRQTVLFSATFPDSIEGLSKSFQTKAVRVTIADEIQDLTALEQIYHIVEPADKPLFLQRLLRRMDPDAALIFANLKVSVAELGEILRKENFGAEVLHGDLDQRERDEVMAKFRNGSVRYLVATDVAARGLDIPSLPLVVNYEMAGDVETYLHRIGRTGRAGQSGVAVSLVSATEKRRIIEVESATAHRPELRALPSRGEASLIPRPAPMRTLFVAGGRKQKVRPGDIMGALTGEAGFAGSQIGKIELHDNFCYVAVDRKIAETARERLQNGRIKGHHFFVKLLD